MSTVLVPGDLVLHGQREMVVVEIQEHHEGVYAVLREQDDLEGERPVGVLVNGLARTGHLEPTVVTAGRSWIEDEPGSGEWREAEVGPFGNPT